MRRGDLAELGGEVRLLLRAQILLVEEENEVAAQSGTDLSDGVFPQRFRKVDARDLGSDVRRDGPQIDRGLKRHAYMVAHLLS